MIFTECRNTLLSWLYTYRFSRFKMFVHYFVNYFARWRTNHYTLLTISPISFIFDSVRNLMRNCPYPLFDISWKYRLSGENGETQDEKNDGRDGLRNAIYTLIVSLILPTFFHIFINLTICVQLALMSSKARNTLSWHDATQRYSTRRN